MEHHKGIRPFSPCPEKTLTTYCVSFSNFPFSYTYISLVYLYIGIFAPLDDSKMESYFITSIHFAFSHPATLVEILPPTTHPKSIGIVLIHYF